MIAQLYSFTFDSSDYLIFVFLAFAMFEDMLDNIVSKLILGQAM